MLIKNASAIEIMLALVEANEKFGNNLIFNRFDYAALTRQGKEKFNVTLRVKDSREAGSRLGFPAYLTGKQRHLISACWHAHGTFMDALPAEAEIIVTGVDYPIRPGDRWNDRNIGSIMQPMYYSEACECE